MIRLAIGPPDVRGGLRYAKIIHCVVGTEDTVTNVVQKTNCLDTLHNTTTHVDAGHNDFFMGHTANILSQHIR